MDPRYRGEVNRGVAPAAPGEFAPLPLGPLSVWPPVVLAPMAGVTNYPFRTLCRRFGAGLYVSEMITARPLVQGNQKTEKLATFGPEETIRSLQIYGVDPRYVGALTTTVLDGTPMGDAQARGDFRLPDKFGLLAELRTMVAESELTGCRLSSNHASNYLPLRADLPADKAAIVAVLDRVLAERDERYLRPEYMRAL